ncbi:MAG: hypothetical protein WC412_08220 [Candidatus Omnitrophota bacterium]|jgi:Tfp pilus assembly protein PilP
MTDNILPEEKLLKLIRGERNPPQKADSTPIADSIKKPGIKLFPRNFSIPTFNKAIKLLLVLSFLWLILLFLQPSYAPDKTKQLKTAAVKNPAKRISPDTKEQIKPYSFYLEGIKNRKIFSSAATEDAQKAIGTVNADLIKDINLVGIISGDEPQAVIEDKKAQKTYYLRKGQYIGELRLEDILEGKIVLNYNGQNYELYL